MSAKALMRSSLFKTELKASIIRALLAGELNSVASGASFRALRLHRSVCGEGFCADSKIKNGSLRGESVTQVLGCSLKALRFLIKLGHLEGRVRAAAVVVSIDSLMRFRAKWVCSNEVFECLGIWRSASILRRLLPPECEFLALGKVGFFRRADVPPLARLATEFWK